MQKIIKHLPLLILITIIAACQSQVEDTTLPISNKFDDDVIVSIYDFIDRRDGDSLSRYLRHENELYRYEATLGFGSIQDTSYVLNVAFNLNDSSAKVRKAAAYALGQTKDSSAIKPIVQALEEEDSAYVRKEMLEALGKVITQSYLRQLQYWPLRTDEDKEGLAWGLYRAGVRNVHDGVSVDIALSLLDSSNTYNTRLGAAHFLSRSRNLNLESRQGLIIKSALFDKSPEVRMSSALALRNAKGVTSKNALEKIVKDSDYRVRVNALRSLAAFEDILDAVVPMLDDSNQHVALTAANILVNKVSKPEIDLVKTAVKNVRYQQVRPLLFGAWLKHAEEKEIVIEKIKTEYESTSNPYYKASLLGALSSSIMAQEFVVTKTFSEEAKVISTAGINALAAMRGNENFPEELEASFADLFRQAIETKDIAMIATSARVITDPSFNFKSHYDSAEFLKSVRGELTLPQDIEAIQMLDRAIAFFDNLEYQAPANEYNHPIDWELINDLGKKPIAVVNTDKGSITMKLFIEESPGSVANFVTLSRAGYFNGKNFHRVVPNFVIQGGCNRGDGYGGEDYSIRSELSNLRYGTGSVGMASAGKDTEGTQWFITHSPTPHLDGGYTIFAQVTDGMSVVNNIQIGDKINSIEIN